MFCRTAKLEIIFCIPTCWKWFDFTRLALPLGDGKPPYLFQVQLNLFGDDCGFGSNCNGLSFKIWIISNCWNVIEEHYACQKKKRNRIPEGRAGNDFANTKEWEAP